MDIIGLETRGGGDTVSKILLLTASFGDGHNQAAYAVAEALERYGAAVKVVDYVEWLHPAIKSFAKFSLMQGVQKVPVLYGLFYRSMSRIEPSSSIQRQLNHLGMSKLRRCLQSFDPDIVASTFPTPTGVMSELLASGLTNRPNVAIVTDYTAHRQWVHDHVDAYFVASDSVKRELVSYGVHASRIEVTGIPILSKFSDCATAQLLEQRGFLRQKQGLHPSQPLITLMGGGGGLLGDIAAWESLIQKTRAQFCIICGRNERLYRRLLPLASERVRILGYTNAVDEWMAMSDLIITKAGGITVTEAFAMELPMLLYRPIPGQEERNARYALQTGAASLAYDVRTAAQFLQSVVDDPETLQRMRAACRQQRLRGGATRIAKTVFRMAKKEAGRRTGSPVVPRFS